MARRLKVLFGLTSLAATGLLALGTASARVGSEGEGEGENAGDRGLRQCDDHESGEGEGDRRGRDSRGDVLANNCDNEGHGEGHGEGEGRHKGEDHGDGERGSEGAR